MRYVMTDSWNVLERVTIGYVLANWDTVNARASYFIEKDGDAPSRIWGNSGYLYTLNKNKKITLLSWGNGPTYKLEKS